MARAGISLIGLEDKEAFIRELKRKFPDDDVGLSLEGEKMMISVSDNNPAQHNANIIETLNLAVTERLHPRY